ncbi:methyltransferase domain-containing protein [bacterium]|nr:methyltransferase domain-containing protein [bacterium]
MPAKSLDTPGTVPVRYRLYWRWRAVLWDRWYAALPLLNRVTRLEHTRIRAVLDRWAHTLPEGPMLVPGCGVYHWSAVWWGRPILHLDLAPRMLIVAQNRQTGGWYVAGDAMQLPLQSSSFSAVLAVGLSEYIADPSRWLYELRRVLRPGGLLLLTTTPSNRRTRLRRWVNPALHFRSTEKWCNLLDEAGFRVHGSGTWTTQAVVLARST